MLSLIHDCFIAQGKRAVEAVREFDAKKNIRDDDFDFQSFARRISNPREFDLNSQLDSEMADALLQCIYPSFLGEYEDENFSNKLLAKKSANWYFDGKPQPDEPGSASVIEIIQSSCSEIGPRKNCLNHSLGEEDLLNCKDVFNLKPCSSFDLQKFPLLLPDDEAASIAARSATSTSQLTTARETGTVEEAVDTGQTRRKLLGIYCEAAWKKRNSWMKSWKKQYIWVDQAGISYSRLATRREQTELRLDEIKAVRLLSPDDPASKNMKQDTFYMRNFRGEESYIAPMLGPNAMTAADWCTAISSHALIYSIQNNLGLERAESLIRMGADVDSALSIGKQYPCLALAYQLGSMDIVRLLIQKGSDPSCLLRWSFMVVDNAANSLAICDLLIEMNADLNIAADDVHGWSLLHYCAYEGCLTSTTKLLKRVDKLAINEVNTLGDTALMVALKKHSGDCSSDIQELCMLLADSCVVDKLDKWGDNCLHLAIRNGHECVAKRLIERGSNLFLLDRTGDTAILLALKSGCFEFVRWMVLFLREPLNDGGSLQKVQDTLNVQDRANGDTAFTIALKLGKEDLALFLLHSGADFRIIPTAWNLGLSCEKDLPLHIAIKFGMESLAKTMVAKTLTMDELTTVDTQGYTSLMLSLKKSILKLAIDLVHTFERLSRLSEGQENSLSKNNHDKFLNFLDIQCSRNGDTSLLLALRRGLIMTACTLIQHGSNVNIQNKNGTTALHLCIDLLSMPNCNSFKEAIILEFMRGLFYFSSPVENLSTLDTQRFRLMKPVDARHQTMQDLHTPLHRAALTNQTNAARLLLKGCPELIDIVEADGNSALGISILSAPKGVTSLVELLLLYKANTNIINKASHCCLHLAVGRHRVDIIQILLMNDAYPGVWDVNGRAPIHVATIDNHLRSVEAFLTHCKIPGCFDLRTESGYTPLMLAALEGSRDIFRLLMNAGADFRASLPHLRQNIFHLAGELTVSRKHPLWENGIAELILQLPYSKSAPWDIDCKGVSGSDALRKIKECMFGESEEIALPSDSQRRTDSFPLNNNWSQYVGSNRQSHEVDESDSPEQLMDDSCDKVTDSEYADGGSESSPNAFCNRSGSQPFIASDPEEVLKPSDISVEEELPDEPISVFPSQNSCEKESDKGSSTSDIVSKEIPDEQAGRSITADLPQQVAADTEISNFSDALKSLTRVQKEQLRCEYQNLGEKAATEWLEDSCGNSYLNDAMKEHMKSGMSQRCAYEKAIHDCKQSFLSEWMNRIQGSFS